jgi:hypothetical protein
MLPCDCGAQTDPHMGMQHDSACPFVTGKPRPRCTGSYDDGIADGNLTNCSITGGCCLPGCPHLARFRGTPALIAIDPTPDDKTDGLLIPKVENCARCQGTHELVHATKLTYPMSPRDAIWHTGEQMTWTHWFPCPTNGQPVMVMTEVPE